MASSLSTTRVLSPKPFGGSWLVRVILYTGKGGVGKTTVAAATAIRCAALGYKTLVVSTDAAHSLGDSLDAEVDEVPTPIAENLWAQEVNALHELEHHWEKIHRYLIALFASQGIDEIVAEEMATPPGMEEVASLLWIKRHKESGEFDVIIVDCAPTGETLQLLAFPDVAKWYLEHLFPWQKKLNKVARPLIQPLVSIPLPTDDILEYGKELLLDLEAMKRIIGNPEECTIRIVLNLEKMVIKEAQRAYTYLSLYDYLTDLIVVNRVLPNEVHDEYFTSWKASQAKYSELVDQAFSPVPIVRSNLFSHEMVGLDSLRELGNVLFAHHDPAAILYNSVAQRIEKHGKEYELQLSLPFASKEGLDLSHNGNDLFVTVGPYKRDISLPRVLHGKTVQRAKLDEGILRVTFGVDGHDA